MAGYPPLGGRSFQIPGNGVKSPPYVACMFPRIGLLHLSFWMDTPKKLTALFGKDRPPEDLHAVASYECFYVVGLKDALKAAGVRARLRSFRPHLKQAPKLARKSGWPRQLPDKQLWSKCSSKQAERALSFEPITLPKAAMVLLVAQRLIEKLAPRSRTNLYRRVQLVPALSYVTGLTFEVFDEFRRAAEATPSVIAGYESVKKYLRKKTAQDDDRVFEDMVKGKTVTRTLADDLCKLIKTHLKPFDGTVESDWISRKKGVMRLRHEDADAAGMKKRYVRKISASKNETVRK